jgi:hypothetical protein
MSALGLEVTAITGMVSKVGKYKENAAFMSFSSKDNLLQAINYQKKFKWEGNVARIMSLSDFEDYKVGKLNEKSPKDHNVSEGNPNRNPSNRLVLSGFRGSGLSLGKCDYYWRYTGCFSPSC